ncbi:hypothetical protein PQX77_019108, partial [Marasmius sp. AFHP31]
MSIERASIYSYNPRKTSSGFRATQSKAISNALVSRYVNPHIRRYKTIHRVRYKVPLDYNNPDGNKAAIAIIRLPANVSSDSQDYRGPILFNPGGPGGSGVDYVLAAGATHRVGLGPQFDLVRFDPRGVQRSTPRIEFYESRAERALSFRPYVELNQSRETVESWWASSQIMGTLAYERGKDYLGHMNTPNSARDMLSIVEAYGQEKLQYWGFS